MSRFFTYWIPIVLFIPTTIISAQGSVDGFYRGKGNTTLVLGVGFEDTKHYFAGRDRTGFGRNLYSFSGFVSYGITNNLDVQASLPFLISNKQSDFQDLQLWMKYRWFQSDSEKRSIQLSFAGGFSSNVTGYRLGGLNDLGQQAKIIETRLIAHYSGNQNWFLTGQSGFSFKLGATPSSFPFTLKVGRATSKLYYDLWYDFQHSFGGIDYLGTPSPQNFREFGVSYHKVGGTVYVPFSDRSGMYFSPSYVLTGRNTFQGLVYHLGWVYNFRKKG